MINLFLIGALLLAWVLVATFAAAVLVTARAHEHSDKARVAIHR
jgi:hypothetical protein